MFGFDVVFSCRQRCCLPITCRNRCANRSSNYPPHHSHLCPHRLFTGGILQTASKGLCSEEALTFNSVKYLHPQQPFSSVYSEVMNKHSKERRHGKFCCYNIIDINFYNLNCGNGFHNYHFPISFNFIVYLLTVVFFSNPY